MDDGDEPRASADHPSAAVRLLRSVAPWTAPNPVESDAAPSGETARETEQDRSINGPGIAIWTVLVWAFLLAGAYMNRSDPEQADAPSAFPWGTLLVAVVAASFVWLLISRQMDKGRLRRDGMRASAAVTYIQPPMVSGLLGQRVVYSYETKGGSQHGHATLGRNAPPKVVGDHIPILYDIAHQDVSLVE